MSFHKLQDNQVFIDFDKLSCLALKDDFNHVFMRREQLLLGIRNVKFDESHKEFVDTFMKLVEDVFNADLKALFDKHGLTMRA
jgi:hypothetical protein